jgi:hypothetical protein
LRGINGSRARIFRDQVGVTAEAIAGSLNLDDNCMVKQAIQQSGGDDSASKDLAPFGKAAV